MVSDASSGPPHAHEEDDCCYHHLSEKNGCYFSASSSFPPAAAPQDKCWKKRRVETQHQNRRQVPNALLDDTASSPFLGVPGNVRRLLLHQQNCKPVVSSPLPRLLRCSNLFRRIACLIGSLCCDLYRPPSASPIAAFAATRHSWRRLSSSHTTFLRLILR